MFRLGFLSIAQANKVYYAGEYGWTGANPDAATFLHAAETLAAASQLSGTAFWSLMPHNDSFGFTQHFDGFSFYYPGAPNDGVARGFATLIQSHAAVMSGRPIPKVAPVPKTAPLITLVICHSTISFLAGLKYRQALVSDSGFHLFDD
jgi:hypothetical protein